MSKMPAFQFYPADWKKDLKVQSLSFEEKGIWFEILCLMHESEQRGRLVMNGKAMTLKTIAKLISCDPVEFEKAMENILLSGVAYKDEAGIIYNKRMVEDERIIQIRREAGKKGGNPVLLNQKPTTPVKQNPTPSSSSSSSSSNKQPSKDKVVETLRRMLNSSFSDRLIDRLAGKILSDYEGKEIHHLTNLCNTYAAREKPDMKVRFYNPGAASYGFMTAEKWEKIKSNTALKFEAYELG